MNEDLINRITYYLSSGGLFNPELADHLAVRNLLIECREALAQTEQEPAEYQMRMRPTWEVSSWGDWKKCSRDAFEDYTKTPKLHDWEYEVRKLYTIPPQRTLVGLTPKELNTIFDGFKTWSSFQITDVYFAIEAKLKERNT